MASIIPKIKVGRPDKREKLNLSFDNSTTANIGSIQPTMCREMVPNETLKVKTTSLVRLFSMPLPTFGRMSLRHYHAFVPYASLYEPFTAMLSGQHYTGEADTWIPTQVPAVLWSEVIVPLILAYSDISIAPIDDMYHPITLDVNGDMSSPEWQAEFSRAANAASYILGGNSWFGLAYSGHVPERAFFGNLGRASINSADGYGLINFGNTVCAMIHDDITDQTFGDKFKFRTLVQTDPNYESADGQLYSASGNTVITPEGADLITQYGDYCVLFKFKPMLKRFRTILIGLGYQFSPYNNEAFSYLKLLAYYKVWFELFRPNRELAFQDTNCYKLIKKSSNDPNYMAYFVEGNLFYDFLLDMVRDCYYYLPMDYFSMSVVKPQQQMSENTFNMLTYSSDGNDQYASLNTQRVSAEGGIPFSPNVVTGAANDNPLLVKMALRLLTFANKNTVVGRSIRNYLKVHYGVAEDAAFDSSGIVRIGSSRVNINISDIMSTAENEQGYLGEYGGRGIGYGENELFDFTAKEFGCWLTLTVVVPESGMYQGYMKENRHLNRYQFFMPEFDALGYQVLERGEVMDDYNCDLAEGYNGIQRWSPSIDYVRTAAFGFVPRYSEYKVGRNIVNGDLSLVGLKNDMSPYTLERRLSGGQFTTGTGDGKNVFVRKPDFVPSVVYDGFRRIDPSDHIGQYNRIFNYGGNDLDHFVIHNLFYVEAFAPMKSLTSSFDTIENGESTIEVSHS